MVLYKRRDFLNTAAASALASVARIGPANCSFGAAADFDAPGFRMRFGLVTYMWAASWDLATLIANCEETNVLGVELRTTHAHGVEPALDAKQRREVQQRFADSNIKLVGLGSNERFDSPDPEDVKKAIEATKQFVVLSHDTGGTGVKVKPNDFHAGVPKEKTIEQIGESLNELGRFAAGYGQEIRLEVHGSCSHLPDIDKILRVADHVNVALCWNSNAADLEGEGLEHNFQLVKDRFGDTCHVRPLDDPGYPFPQLIQLLADMEYDGWVMLEDGRVPANPVSELAKQRLVFERMVANLSRAD